MRNFSEKNVHGKDDSTKSKSDYYFQYFDRSKTTHDRAKLGLAGQRDGQLSKNYFEPCIQVLCADSKSSEAQARLTFWTDIHVQSTPAV